MAHHHYFNPLSGTDGEAHSIIADINDDTKKLILYFHGGLSSPKYIKEDLGPFLSQTMFAPNYLDQANAKVVFVLYEASLFQLDTLKNALKNMGLKIEVKGILERVVAWLARRGWHEELAPDVSRISNDVQIADFANSILIESELTEIDEDDEASITAAMTAYLQRTSDNGDGEELIVAFNALDDFAALQSAELAGMRFALTIFFRTIMRFRRKTSHGITATLVEEILHYSFAKNIEISDIPQGHWDTVYDNATNLWESSNTYTNGAGQTFITALNDLCANRPELEVDLISHSAGSIPICYFLNELDAHPHITVKNVLPIAPAVRMLDFFEHIVKRQDRFDTFRMYTLDENTEENDRLVGKIYPRSLLYFVSGVADTHNPNRSVRKRGEQLILGLHRHFQTDRNPYTSHNHYDNVDTYGDLDDCRSFLHSNDRLVLCPNSGSLEPGKVGGGTTHGGTKTPHTSENLTKSLIYMYSNGVVNPGTIATTDWATIAQEYGL